MSWAELQWAVGKVGHREVRTLRQGGLEGWKESASHLKSLGNIEEPGQVQEVFILQIIKNVFKRGNKMSFGGWVVNKRGDKSLKMWPRFCEVCSAPSNSPHGSGFGISSRTGPLPGGKKETCPRGLLPPKKFLWGKHRRTT